jgi:hypothetical protein
MLIMSGSPRDVMGHEAVTVDATAGGVGLTVTKYNPVGSAGMNHKAKYAYCTVEDQEIRYSVDPATVPEAGTGGHEVAAGGSFWLYGQMIPNFKAIRTGGSSGVLRVTYFG